MQRTFVKTTRPGDSFWSEVIEPFGPNALKVRVDNHLAGTAIHGLKYGDEFILKKSEVIDIRADAPPPGSGLVVTIGGNDERGGCGG